MQSLNLNADVGEGFSFDEMLMPYLSYCNIACGGHIGNKESIERTMKLAKEHQVKIGAHLSYPDPENFGRKSMTLSSNVFKDALKSQLYLFKEALDKTQCKMHHIKAHGALYHDIIDRPDIGKNFIECLHSELGNDTELKLLSRREENAVLNNAEDISSQIIKLIHNQKVFTTDGSWKDIACDTICIHGDHPMIEIYFPEMIRILKSRNLLQ